MLRTGLIGADVAVLLEPARRDGPRHGDRRQVRDRFDPPGDRQPDQLSRTNHIRPEQLVVGQYVVDQRGGMHDEVHCLGQPVEGVRVEAEVPVHRCRRRAPRDVRPPARGIVAAMRDPRCRRLSPAGSAPRRRSGPRTMVIRVPPVSDRRSSHSSARNRPSQPLAPVNSTVLGVPVGARQPARSRPASSRR